MSNELYESLRMENASLNKLYQKAMIKMKKIQNEYESLYLNYVNQNEKRENAIKNNYLKYQILFQKHYEKEEKKYMEEISNLKNEIYSQNTIINKLQKYNAHLKDILNKKELNFHLKEKEYQIEIMKKDQMLMKSSDMIKKNSKEVMNDIQKLKKEINYFQNKLKNNKNNNNNKNNRTINVDSNLSYYYDKFDKYNLKKKSSSLNIKDYIGCNCNCHKYEINKYANKSLYNIIFPNQKQSNISSLINNQSDDNNTLLEVYILKNTINDLNNLIKQKDEEILFWKNYRKDSSLDNSKLYTYNYKNNINNYKLDITRNKSLNRISTIDTTKQNIIKFRRSYSQLSNHFRPLKKKIDLDLIDSNNKPIIRKYFQSKEN